MGIFVASRILAQQKGILALVTIDGCAVCPELLSDVLSSMRLPMQGCQLGNHRGDTSNLILSPTVYVCVVVGSICV